MNYKAACISLALLCLLLPSCVAYHTGQRIREAGEIHTGLDVRHPVDGKLYRTPDMVRQHSACVRAQEVTYRMRTPLLTPALPGFRAEDYRRVRDISPTGNTRLALITCEMPNDYCYNGREPKAFCELAETLPAGARAYAAQLPRPLEEMKDYERAAEQEKCASPDAYGSLSKTEASLGRRIAATTCSYTLDPLLSITHAVVAVPVGMVALPVGALYLYFTGTRL